MKCGRRLFKQPNGGGSRGHYLVKALDDENPDDRLWRINNERQREAWRDDQIDKPSSRRQRSDDVSFSRSWPDNNDGR